jgi:hypothetical protein
MMNHKYLKSHLDKLTAKHEVSAEVLEEIQIMMARYAHQAMTRAAVAAETKKALQAHFIKCLREHGASRLIEI